MATVLIVDDILINRILLGEVMQQLDYETAFAENGLAALEMLKKGVSELVLMDVEMPVMNGIEATRAIKNDTSLSKVKVIGVTAHDPKTFFNDYADVSFDAFITKPYTLDRVQKVLDAL
jgi:CheY-like chemotaxis protein